jgi:hypothetical protein
MFIRYYVELALPVDVVERALLDEPAVWLPGHATPATDRGEALLTRVGFGGAARVSKAVVIEVLGSIRVPDKIILPIRWHAADPEALLPTLDADVEVAALTPETTQLSMSARYDPPLGAVGRAVDRALLHRVAEATLKDFLDRVAASLLDTRAHAAGA